ncbi:MAG: hypothetical protein ABIT10_09570 [Alteraurantiacibacter sp.]
MSDAATPSFAARLSTEQLALLRAGKRWLLLYVAATSLPFIGIDYAYPSVDPGYVFLTSVFFFAAGYGLMWKLLDLVGVRVVTGIGTYFMIGCVTGVAVVVGLIVFVVPGLYLILRWLAAYPRAMASDNGVGSAMFWSWDKTQPHQQALALALVPPVVVLAATYLPALIWTEYEPVSDLTFGAVLAFVYLASAIGYAWLTLLMVATYRALVGAYPEG